VLAPSGEPSFQGVAISFLLNDRKLIYLLLPSGVFAMGYINGLYTSSAMDYIHYIQKQEFISNDINDTITTL